ncbi:hypothetical protein [Leptolyngbya sp. FACHB-16]|uniref:hypothetical protein n=1 Tax=unclassified Leptolyngbya TaxID=2650499 RepID=UPI001682139C|nr:hypothetical protein [Leptolyngbya sp. FACHB-16]MBD2156207.1 hypothetical protein [Leptolyngbya sp. FACHB-16]
MKLSDFPGAIAALQQVVRTAKDCRDQTENRLARLKLRVEYAVAFDSDLKNDNQRKAKLGELMSTAEMEEAVTSLNKAQDTVAQAEIELTLMLNQFSVAKLETRQAIATIEMQTAIH